MQRAIYHAINLLKFPPDFVKKKSRQRFISLGTFFSRPREENLASPATFLSMSPNFLTVIYERNKKRCGRMLLDSAFCHTF